MVSYCNSPVKVDIVLLSEIRETTKSHFKISYNTYYGAMHTSGKARGDIEILEYYTIKVFTQTCSFTIRPITALKQHL